MSRTTLPIRNGLVASALSLLGVGSVASAQPYSMPMNQDETRWRVVVDGVMGGLSSGSVEQSSDGMMFEGKLRLENNGGFSQIRTPIEKGSLEYADGIEIEVRGDGRTYIFDARVANFRVMAGSFQQTFETVDDEWKTIRLPLAEFKFHSFGRLIPGVGEIRSSMINSLGITLADKNPGAFDLEIRSIRGYEAGDVYDERLSKLGEELGLNAIIVVPDREEIDERTLRITKLGTLLASSEVEPSDLRDSRGTSGTFASDVSELCMLAIERGVPLFNDGQTEACAVIYEITLASILQLGEEKLDEETRVLIARTLRDGQRVHDASDRAWHYRRAIDSILRSFNALG